MAMFVDPPLVDVHAHVFTTDMPLSDTAWSRPGYSYSVEAFLADLDENGIPFGVIAAASLYDDFSDYTLQAGRHARLRSTVIVHPDVGLDVLRRLREARRRRHPAATSSHRNAARPEFGRVSSPVLPASRPRLARPRPDRRTPGQRTCSPSCKPPAVKLVVDHFGYPEPGGQGLDSAGHKAVLRSLEAGNTWVKVSAAFRFPDRTLLRAYANDFIAKVGPGRMLWGSDSPFVGFEGRVSYRDTLDAFYGIVPDPAVRRAISETGLRLYFF